MEIEYCSGKKNPVDGPSWHPDYIDPIDNEEKKTLHTIGYMTRDSIKYEKAQKAIENACQATQRSEVTSETNTLESHLTDNKSLLYDTVDDRVEILLSERSNVPDSDPIETRRTFSKHKRKESTKQVKKVLLKRRKKKKLDETSLDSQPMRLYFMTRDNKMAHVNREAAKKISKKESIFASLSLKMRQILQALQKTDHFAQTMKPCALKTGPLAPQRKRKEKMPMSVKSGKFERTMM